MREYSEQLERRILSEYAALSAETRGRIKPESPCPIRTDFARDRDRIIHSSAFRRLKQKTQVFLAPQGDHYRTRLTHTLEVSQIARTIARALRLNEDLTEAIALGHDLGHTPFGHAGEHALDQVTPFPFRHNLQSVRVVDQLERNGKGLNLTYEVKNGIACHCTGCADAMTLEGKIVEYSDKIAYVNHDIEDAVRAGVLQEKELPYDCIYILGHTKSERITTILQSIISCSFGKNKILMDPEVEKAHGDLRKFMFEAVYHVPPANTENQRAAHVVECLYEYFKTHPEKLPPLYHHILEKEGIDRAAADCVASMTDGYAVDLYQQIYIPRTFLSPPHP
ncbi:MAG: deoxyguanosinetriphosphate triphosphohydrolase [Massiliimalia sp.]|jgi:dGTPase